MLLLSFLSLSLLQMASLPDLELERLPEEMPLVEEAARLSDEALDAAATLLHRETQFLLQQIQQARPGGGPWGPSELERLRRLHGEVALGLQRIRQRYTGSKDRVTGLARFYGEEPQRPTAAAAAAAAAVAAAAGEGWGGLLLASPFPTLAAILVTFKQTLRDIQQHPKRYAVLLATNNSNSNSNSSSSSKETAQGNAGKEASPATRTAADPPVCAAASSAETAAAADAAASAPAAAAPGKASALDAHLVRKCSDPAAVAWGGPKGPHRGTVDFASPKQQQQRFQPREAPVPSP